MCMAPVAINLCLHVIVADANDSAQQRAAVLWNSGCGLLLRGTRDIVSGGIFMQGLPAQPLSQQRSTRQL